MAEEKTKNEVEAAKAGKATKPTRATLTVKTKKSAEPSKAKVRKKTTPSGFDLVGPREPLPNINDEKVDVRRLWCAPGLSYVGTGANLPIVGKPPSLRRTRKKKVLFDHPLRAQVEAEIKAEKEAKALKKKKSAKKPAAETPRKKHPSPETVKKQLSKVEKQERLEAESIAQNALHAETQERLDTLFSDEEKAPDEVASDNATLDEATPTEATPSLESPLSEEEAAIRETQEKASEKWVHSPLDETGAEYENVATEETLEGQALTASDAPTVEQLKKGGEDTIVRHPLTFDKETDEVDAMAVLEALDALYSGESLISEDAKHRNARYSGEGLYTPEPPEEEEEEDDDDWEGWKIIEGTHEEEQKDSPKPKPTPIVGRSAHDLLPIHFDTSVGVGRWVTDDGRVLSVEEFQAYLAHAIAEGLSPTGESEAELLLRRAAQMEKVLPQSEAYIDYARAMLYWEIQTLFAREREVSYATDAERTALPLGLTTEERARYREMNPTIDTDAPMTLGGLPIPPEVMEEEMRKFKAQEKAAKEKEAAAAARPLSWREKLGLFWRYLLSPVLGYTFSRASRIAMVLWGLGTILLGLVVLYHYWASLIVDDRDPALLALIDDPAHELVAVYDKALLKNRFIWASVGEHYGLKVPRADLRVNPQWTLENLPPVQDLAIGTQHARYSITKERLESWLTKCMDAESRALGRHLLDVASPLIGNREQVDVTHRVLWRCGLEKVDPASIQEALFGKTVRLRTGTRSTDPALNEAEDPHLEGPAIADATGAAAIWTRVEAHLQNGTPMPAPDEWTRGVNGLDKPIVVDPIFHPLGEPYRSGRAVFAEDAFPRAATLEEVEPFSRQKLTPVDEGLSAKK